VAIRAFVAAFPPVDDRAAIHERVGPLLAVLPQLRAVAAENYHVTLRFLGPMGLADVGDLRAALEPMGRRSRPVRCISVGLRSLPSVRRTRVVAFELHSDGLLEALGDDVHRALTARFGRADRPFFPHLTVLRSKRATRAVMPTAPGIEPTLSSIGLYRSDTHPSGARYSALFELPFGLPLERA